jgi:hypothetical protein
MVIGVHSQAWLFTAGFKRCWESFLDGLAFIGWSPFVNKTLPNGRRGRDSGCRWVAIRSVGLGSAGLSKRGRGESVYTPICAEAQDKAGAVGDKERVVRALVPRPAAAGILLYQKGLQL